jgi:hypothetical protein
LRNLASFQFVEVHCTVQIGWHYDGEMIISLVELKSASVLLLLLQLLLLSFVGVAIIHQMC